MMEDFRRFPENAEWCDYLICNHCDQRVERGIVNVSNHWMNCLKRTEGLIIARNDWEKVILDSWSVNVNETHTEL